jgi:hypothetical protein
LGNDNCRFSIVPRCNVIKPTWLLPTNLRI